MAGRSAHATLAGMNPDDSSALSLLAFVVRGEGWGITFGTSPLGDPEPLARFILGTCVSVLTRATIDIYLYMAFSFLKDGAP